MDREYAAIHTMQSRESVMDYFAILKTVSALVHHFLLPGSGIIRNPDAFTDSVDIP